MAGSSPWTLLGAHAKKQETGQETKASLPLGEKATHTHKHAHMNTRGEKDYPWRGVGTDCGHRLLRDPLPLGAGYDHWESLSPKPRASIPA